jgi:hypothetical protein
MQATGEGVHHAFACRSQAHAALPVSSVTARANNHLQAAGKQAVASKPAKAVFCISVHVVWTQQDACRLTFHWSTAAQTRPGIFGVCVGAGASPKRASSMSHTKGMTTTNESNCFAVVHSLQQKAAYAGWYVPVSGRQKHHHQQQQQQQRSDHVSSKAMMPCASPLTHVAACITDSRASVSFQCNKRNSCRLGTCAYLPYG